MVEVVFTRPTTRGPEEFARLRAFPGHPIQPVFGNVGFVLDFAPYSAQYGRPVSATEDPVAWARALPQAYVQQAQVDAAIVVDTDLAQAWGQTQPARPAQAVDGAGEQLRKSPVFWWLLGSSVAMVFGGFGPWATALGFVDVSGTRGDGWFVILGGFVGCGLCAHLAFRERNSVANWQYVVLLVVAAIALLVAVVDLADISDRSEFVQPGWGLWFSLLASLSAIVAAITAMVTKPARPPRTA
jgi:hypothetical protein